MTESGVVCVSVETWKWMKGWVFNVVPVWVGLINILFSDKWRREYSKCVTYRVFLRHGEFMSTDCSHFWSIIRKTPDIPPHSGQLYRRHVNFAPSSPIGFIVCTIGKVFWYGPNWVWSLASHFPPDLFLIKDVNFFLFHKSHETEGPFFYLGDQRVRSSLFIRAVIRQLR